MPVTYYVYDLEKEEPGINWLRVRIETTSGDPFSFTVQYETTIDGERVPVVRYDTAHGRPHRDLLDDQGKTIEKRFLPDHWTFKEALDHARQDTRTNWRDYLKEFVRRTQ